MTQKKKLKKRVWAASFGGAALFALIIVLATCSMFDSKTAESIVIDWNTIVKNSSWSFDRMNVPDSGKLISALQTVKTIRFSEDLDMIIEYGDKGHTYSFSVGSINIGTGLTGASLGVSMAGDSGYVTNNLRINFSCQEKKQFDNNSYVLTLTVKDVGSLYFFKD